MRHPTSVDHPISHAVLAPLQRILESPWSDRLVGVAAAALTTLWNDIFIILWFLALASAVTDTVYGRRLHLILEDYDPRTAEIGLHGKLAGLTMAIIVRGVEWAVAARLLVTLEGLNGFSFLAFVVGQGLFSAAMAATLLGQDLRSIQEKRERFGQEPIPVFTAAMRLLDKAVRVVTGAPPPDSEIRHRREDDRREDDER